MAIQLDRIILDVSDRTQSIEFYVSILGLKHEGERDSFSVIRVTPEFTLQLAPSGTKGGEHPAFAISRKEFDSAFRRSIDRGSPYGDSYHAVTISAGQATSRALGAGQGAPFFSIRASI